MVAASTAPDPTLHIHSSSATLLPIPNPRRLPNPLVPPSNPTALSPTTPPRPSPARPTTAPPPSRGQRNSNAANATSLLPLQAPASPEYLAKRSPFARRYVLHRGWQAPHSRRTTCLTNTTTLISLTVRTGRMENGPSRRRHPMAALLLVLVSRPVKRGHRHRRRQGLKNRHHHLHRLRGLVFEMIVEWGGMMTTIMPGQRA